MAGRDAAAGSPGGRIRPVERFQRFDGGRQRFTESVGVVDLRDVVARNLCLVSGDRKDS